MLHFKLVKKIKKTIKDSLTMSDTLAEFVNETNLKVVFYVTTDSSSLYYMSYVTKHVISTTNA